jgi:hypothetical protein
MENECSVPEFLRSSLSYAGDDMSTKNQELTVALQEYLRRGGASKLMGNAFSIVGLVVIGQVLQQIEHLSAPIAVICPVLTDPFTILAAAVFLFSRTTFDFMAFRIQRVGTPVADQDPLLRQLKLPRKYRESFGTDIVFRVWKCRLAFVLLFGVAALRWIWTWNNFH